MYQPRLFCALIAIILPCARSLSQTVDSSSLSNKFILGYQGWHACSGDGSALNLYIHWSHVGGVMPSPSDVTEDIWPDLSEFAAGELFPTGFTLGNGQPAKAYSCYLTNTVLRHFKWMRDYGIDGVALQRFTKDVFSSSQWAALKNTNLLNVKLGAETYGRVLFLMYDISNDDPNLALSHLQTDWAYMVNTVHLTNSTRYLKHHGKPLVCVWWGMGFNPGMAITTNGAQAIIDYFRAAGCTVMGGVPANWRTLNGDSQTNSGWATVYRSFDVISPWTVGRYQTDSQADSFRNSTVIPDLADCQSNSIDYLPVVFPGYSAHNLGGGGLNGIPRNGGRFFWRQIYNTLSAGSSMLYGAMFDEIDEGTALYKLAPTMNETPAAYPTNQYQFFALNVDSNSLPSDWYLRVTGQGTLAAHRATPLNTLLPITPTNSLTVTAPNGGQTWTAGTSASVTWSSTGIVGNVNIDLSTDGGTSFRSLAYNVPNSGSKTLTVPYYPGSNCLVRIASTNGAPVDWSDAVFTIRTTNNNPRIELKSLWNLTPGSRSYLPSGGNNSERGLAYYPALDELYLIYASNPSSANVLDGTTGAQKWTLNLTSVSGGSFLLNKVGVTADGVIYAGNVSVPGAGSPPVFKLYRWANSNPATLPTVAYSGPAGF
ncbi:MAG TPA: glycoside hydrolase family 71/99-like protein, partial [Candidatus Dormibacteraeota bacterium]|nr:glycoside hydrolase family 71/99-like protein [Candidatus Dormibacteraeota bacterium]